MTTRPLVLETRFSTEHDEPQERIACPCCGADDAVPHRVAHDRLFGIAGTYRVVRCRRCSMMYTNPRPAFTSLGRHYPDDYFCYDPPEALRGFRGWVLKAVIRGLVKRRIALLERAVGRLGAGTRVCDVGCSHGQLLLAMQQQRACEVVGVDFNDKMVEHCWKQGVPARLGTLSNARFPDASFDVVTMTEYLEHEGNPAAVLEESRRVTRNGGHLAIEVPLISALGARLFGNYWSQLDLPRHLMFFTPKTLQRMLASSGYEIVSLRTLPGSIAMSLMHVFGYERIGRMTTLDILVSALFTIPLLPFAPFLHEFVYVIARAVPRPQVATPAFARSA